MDGGLAEFESPQDSKVSSAKQIEGLILHGADKSLCVAKPKESAIPRILGNALFVILCFYFGGKFGWYLAERLHQPHEILVEARLNVGLDFNWTDVTPTSELIWLPCYDRLECARLSVPLDYSNPSGEKAAIALAKVPARVASTDPTYRGPILFNPGGPGGSGVMLMLSQTFTDNLHLIVGSQYDLIGFDPRGVGFTTPIVRVFSSDLESIAWSLEAVADANFSIDALGRLYGRAQILGQIAEEHTRHSAEHVSTATVARDMLSIVKAHGRDKLSYWGFSYGTVLGATFAAMFPDNVDRIVIDGVVDSENYYDTLWDNNLRDTDAALVELYQSCVDVGPAACPLHENSTSLITARVNRIIEDLTIKPWPYYNSAYNSYGMFEAADMKMSIFATLYSVHAAGRYLFDVLAALENVTSHLHQSHLTMMPAMGSMLRCDCSAEPPTPLGFGKEVTLAIACGDGEEVFSGVDELREHYESMARNYSAQFASLWGIRAECSGWKIRAKDRFTGMQTLLDPVFMIVNDGAGPFVGNTSYPLLLIGNTADPVTPLWNAHKMSRGFNGSVVLTQNSPGHCSVSATSLCTAKYVNAYFRNGTLPPPNTTCEVESSVFGEVLRADEETLSLEDKQLLWASNALQKRYFVPRMFGYERGVINAKVG